MGFRIDIVTIFPEYFGSPLGVSLIGKAAARGDIEFRVHDLRRWAKDVHHTVDDVAFGGGPGMVMKPDVWGDALDEIIPSGDTDAGSVRLVVPTPSGVPFTQDMATRPSMPSYRPQANTSRGSVAYRAAMSWVNGTPLGVGTTSRADPASVSPGGMISSSASPQTSGFITMPGPPPNATSSTV